MSIRRLLDNPSAGSVRRGHKSAPGVNEHLLAVGQHYSLEPDDLLAVGELIAGPPTSHFSISPSPARTSRVIIGCGFAQLTVVTVPFTVTSLEEFTGHE